MNDTGHDPVRFGVLSTARINDAVLRSISPSSRLSLLAVASRDQDRAAAFARSHGIERAYGSYDALLADPDVEAVYISLPNFLHVKWSIRALEAGKHVLCEKPFTPRALDVEPAFAAARASGRILSEGFMYRHHPQTRRVAELIAEGKIGRVRLIRASFRWPLRDLRDVTELQPGIDGGALMYTGCYCVHSARLFAGAEPDAVYAEAVPATTGVDVSCHGTLRFPAGIVAQFDASLLLPYRQHLELVGEEGVISLEGPWRVDWGGGTIELWPRRIGPDRGPLERIEIEPADSFLNEFEHFCGAVRGEHEPLPGRAETFGQARTLEALFLSAAERRSVLMSEIT